MGGDPARAAGSGAFAGVYDLDHVLARTDESGVSIGDELKRIGYAGDAPPGARPVAAYLEAHIEQGPVLEAENTIIGVVTGGQGKRSYEVTIKGQDAHAGTTPHWNSAIGAPVLTVILPPETDEGLRRTYQGMQLICFHGT